MKLHDASNGQDPLEEMQKWIGLRPSVQEQVQHTAHTQVDIPQRQAMLLMKMRFFSYLGIVFVFVLAGVSGWLLDSGHKLLALAILSIDGILLLAGLAWYPSRKLLIQRMESEVIDPYHDDTLRELFKGYMDKMQPPEPEIKTEKVLIPFQAYNGERRVEQNRERSPLETFQDLIEFTKEAGYRGLSRDKDWCEPNKPRVRLATGTIVSKPKWREFCEALKEWGLVKQDVKGAYVWVEEIEKDPKRAVDYLVRALREVMDDAKNGLWQPDEPVP